jgi:hypothetical protein
MTDADVERVVGACASCWRPDGPDGQAPVRPAAGARWLLLLLSPLLLGWRRGIKLDSPGPVFFRQERVGRAACPSASTSSAPWWPTRRRGPALTVGADARITRAARWLRRTRLDELPQLIDVLRGHMSLVGPRPEVPRYVAHYPPACASKALAVRPGITDPASLAFIDEAELLAAQPRPRARVHRAHPAGQAAGSRPTTPSAPACGPTCRSSCARCACCWARAQRGAHDGRRTTSGTGSTRCWRGCGRTACRCRWRIDALVVALCWNVTYLFRLGFERWISARPGLRRLGAGRRGGAATWRLLRCCACRRACGASPASARSSA